MGQKIHPKSFRLSIRKNWDSVAFFSMKDYSTLLLQDIKIRQYVFSLFDNFFVTSVVLKRSMRNLVVFISLTKVSLVINKYKNLLDKVRSYAIKISGQNVEIDLVEFKKPDLSAKLVAESIARQLEKRMSFRRSMKKAIGNVLRAGAKGVKIRCSGRLSGAEIARSEWYLEGKMPLHTLNANIDYSLKDASTIYGIIGVKVWIYL